MKKLLLTLTTLFVLPLTMMAQRTIENPVIGARSMGTCTGFFIDKIELTDDATIVYLTNYHGFKENGFKIVSGTTLRSGDKRWKLINAEGIKLDDWNYPKDDDKKFVTHFVLSFEPIDKSLETIDFVEYDDLNAFILYDIALTDKAAEKIKSKITVPDDVKNYAKNIKDNGQSLDKNEFSMDTAIVKGKIYGFDKRTFGDRMGDVTVYINNPILNEQLSYSATLNPDNTYEIKVPMTTKNQIAYLDMEPVISNNVLLTAGKTVVVNYDFYAVYKPWELPDRSLIPYFAGENIDLNYALNTSVSSDFHKAVSGPSVQKELSKLPMSEYKSFILKNYDEFSKRIETLDVTKRAKELLKIELKSNTAYYLSLGQHFIENYLKANNKGKYTKPELGEEYLYYPNLLGIDDIMMFYASDYGYNIVGWKMCFDQVCNKHIFYEEYVKIINRSWKELGSYTDIPKNEQSVHKSYLKKIEKQDTVLTEKEKDFYAKYQPIVEKYIADIYEKCAASADSSMNAILGAGDSFFKDLIRLRDYCQPLLSQTVVSDSIVAEIEKMRFPFYADYVKAQNAAITAKIEAEKARGGYFMHQAGESEGDALFVDLIKDFKGKVVLIDFWNTWCGPCRSAIKRMEPMEKEYEGKDVVFLYLADESSPLDEYNNLIVSMKGHHYRLTAKQSSSLKNKWKFSGIPSYVIVGKDGLVKDFHTGFHGVDYYKTKLNEELGK